MMLAAMTNIEEFQLSEIEASNLSNGLARVAEHYDLGASPKAIAWANLVMVAGGIYGTRIVAYGRRRESERRNARPTLAGTGPVNGSASPQQPPKPQATNGAGTVTPIDRPLNPSDLYGFAGPDTD